MLLTKILIYLSLFIICDGARILAVLPLPPRSHYMAFRPFLEELANRGHHVTVITANPAYLEAQVPANYTEIDIRNEAQVFKQSILSMANGKGIHSMGDQILNLFYQIFDKELKSEAVQKLLGDETKKFDLLLLAACVRTTLSLQHVYKVPVIQMSSFGSLESNNFAFGSTSHPLLYPTIFHQRLNNLTVWEKLVEIYNHFYFMYLDSYYEKLENEMLKKHFPDIPPLSELSKNVELLFLNVHPIWESNRPAPPNVIHLGGLHLKPLKELPKDLKSLIDSSKNGVIYVSFGTNVSPAQIPVQAIAIFLKVFSQLPYNVLWKWDEDDIPGTPKNVRLGKWFPQADLLHHPKVKLFITQGGLHSTEEAIDAGVPMIGIPMFGDQWFNVEKHIYHKIGVRLDIANINENNLKDAINTVIGDESYRNNIVKLRSVINDQPQTSIERAVWWTEYILRHGNARLLRSPAANIPWSEYLLLDLFVIVLMALVLAVILLYSSIIVVIKLLKGKEKIN